VLATSRPRELWRWPEVGFWESVIAIRSPPSREVQCKYLAAELSCSRALRMRERLLLRDALTFAHDSLFPSVPERDFQDL
jgi:hypothetical protein